MKSFLRIRSIRIAAAAAVALAGLTTLVVAGVNQASASTLNGIATIASPAGQTFLASGGSNTAFTVALPANADCTGDSAHGGYHVWSYLVQEGANIAATTFNADTGPSQGLGLYESDLNYYGPVNTAQTTGQIIGIPNDFQWGAAVAGGDFTAAQLLYSGGTSGVWEGGLACANGSGVLSDNWNTEITFTASGTDPNGFTWSAVPGPSGSTFAAVTSPNSATFTEGTTGSFTPTASGTPTPTITETGALPAGLTFAGGVLSGDPSVAGTFPITFKATNGIGNPATQNFTVTVDAPPSITSANSTTFTADSPGTFTVTTEAGFPTATTIAESGALPSGVTVADNGSGTATLAGTPATGSAGTYPLTITAANGVDPGASQAFTLTVNPPVGFHISTTSLPDAVVGTAYSVQLQTSGGGSGTVVWKKTASLPKGLELSSTGLLSGTPTTRAVGSFSVGVSASLNRGTPATASLPFTIEEAPAFNPKAPLATSFDEGTSNTFTVTATGNPTPTITEVGALPTGVTFSDGVLSGTPQVTTDTTTYTLTITATNGVAPDASESFALTDIAPLVIITTSIPDGPPGASYGPVTLGVTGGEGAYAWKKGGTLPKGLSLSSTGQLSGTLSSRLVAGQSYSVPVQVGVREGKTKVVTTATLTLNVVAG